MSGWSASRPRRFPGRPCRVASPAARRESGVALGSRGGGARLVLLLGEEQGARSRVKLGDNAYFNFFGDALFEDGSERPCVLDGRSGGAAAASVTAPARGVGMVAGG